MSDAAIPAGAGSPKLDPESLVLRGNPRPVTRFKRKVVIAALGGTALAVLAAAWMALGSGGHKSPATGQELYNIDRQPKADGLAGLPSGYDKVHPPALGAPLPGDLGPAELRARQGLGLPLAGSASENDTARAEEWPSTLDRIKGRTPIRSEVNACWSLFVADREGLHVSSSWHR